MTAWITETFLYGLLAVVAVGVLRTALGNWELCLAAGALFALIFAVGLCLRGVYAIWRRWP